MRSDNLGDMSMHPRKDDLKRTFAISTSIDGHILIALVLLLSLSKARQANYSSDCFYLERRTLRESVRMPGKNIQPEPHSETRGKHVRGRTLSESSHLSRCADSAGGIKRFLLSLHK
jgi:hypothetical protein